MEFNAIEKVNPPRRDLSYIAFKSPRDYHVTQVWKRMDNWRQTFVVMIYHVAIQAQTH